VNVRVLLFAGLRERAGTGEVELTDVDAGSDVAALLERLADRWPFLREAPLAIACNQAIVERSRRLEDGDELALLPPVSGG
jgi:molybdopterin converting factor small subunit